MATNVLPIGGTEQSQLITVVVNGQSLGVFDSYSGGDAAAASTQHRAGGQRTQTSYATLPKYSGITVSRVFQLTRDVALVKTLRQKAGIVTGSVTVQPLDATGNAYGQAMVASGQFLGVKGLKGDSESEAVQMFELDFSVDSWA